MDHQDSTNWDQPSHTKLHINLSQGVVDIEGDRELVREIYADFKNKLLDGMGYSPPRAPENATSAEPAMKTGSKRRSAPRKKTASEESGSSINADSPKMDKDLDTSGLAAFYGQFEAKNHAEKVLIFLKFLTDKLEIESPNTDQVYTCYEAVNERVPKAFAQAFRDASGRKFGYINYESPTELVATTIGNNHFKLDLNKKSAE